MGCTPSFYFRVQRFGSSFFNERNFVLCSLCDVNKGWYGLVSGLLSVDFIPDINIETAKSLLKQHKLQFSVTAFHTFTLFPFFLLVFYFNSVDHCLMQKNKVSNTFPPQFGLVNRFWRYILDREVLTKPSFVALTYRKTCWSYENVFDHLLDLPGFLKRHFVGFPVK